jgi:hypothetical protein
MMLDEGAAPSIQKAQRARTALHLNVIPFEHDPCVPFRRVGGETPLPEDVAQLHRSTAECREVAAMDVHILSRITNAQRIRRPAVGELAAFGSTAGHGTRG